VTEPSPAPPESPVKAVDEPVEPGSLARFKGLAARLFSLDQKTFRDAYAHDEKERAKRRALGAVAPKAGRGADKD
jgi:hypothetical protein